jgi:hypothetical protein
MGQGAADRLRQAVIRVIRGTHTPPCTRRARRVHMAAMTDMEGRVDIRDMEDMGTLRMRKRMRKRRTRTMPRNLRTRAQRGTCTRMSKARAMWRGTSRPRCRCGRLMIETRAGPGRETGRLYTQYAVHGWSVRLQGDV